MLNVLIVDHSVVPDIRYRQHIGQLLGSIADIEVDFANGVMDVIWRIAHFRYDFIIFDWIDDGAQLGKLIAMLHRIKPDVAMFHLDGDSFIATSRLCGLPSGADVPNWLQNIASHWMLARRVSGKA